MRKDKVNKTIEQLITERIKETEYAIDKSNIIHTYRVKDILAKLTTISIGKYSLEWCNDIIRDEVVYTFYKALLDIADNENMKEEEIDINNNEYIKKTVALTKLRLKKTLIPISKQYKKHNSDILIISALDTFLELTADNIDEYDENTFLSWLIENKNNILTKNQINFLKGNKNLRIDKEKEMYNRIAKRILKEYNTEETITNKELFYIRRIDTLKTLLDTDANNFKSKLSKVWEYDYIIDTIYDNIDIEDIKKFNKNNCTEEIVDKYKSAFSKLLKKYIDTVKKLK